MADKANPFGASSKTRRSPAKEVSDSLVVDSSKQSCKLCNEFDNLEMVRCDNEECKQWFHFACVGVVRADVEKVYWACSECLAKESNIQETVESAPSNTVAENKSTKSSRSSKTQKSRNSSVAKRRQLALERVEEERRLREIREKEYLDQKYKTLEEMVNSETDDELDRVEDVDMLKRAERYTADWVSDVDAHVDLTNDSEVEAVDSQVKSTDKTIAVSSSEQRSSNYPQTWKEIFQNLTGGRLTVLPNQVSSSDSNTQNFQQKFGGNRRDTTYSVFTTQAPINSSAEKRVPKQTHPNSQVHFESVPPVSESNGIRIPVQSTNSTKHQIKNQSSIVEPLTSNSRHEQQVLISVDGGVPTSSAVLFRPSFRIAGVDRDRNSSNENGPLYRSNDRNQSHPGVGRTHFSRLNERMEQPYDEEFLYPPDYYGESHEPRKNENFGEPNRTFVNGRTHSTDFRHNDLDMSTSGPGVRLEANQIAARHAMPKNLPKFSGIPMDWPIFISAYENSTSTCGYSDNENLGRLRDCLQGDAYDAVYSMLLHPSSVPEIIDTLRMLFGRPEFVAESLLEDLQKEAPPRENDLNALIKFALKVKNLVATFRNFGPSDYLQNPLMLNKLVERLPTQTRINCAYFKSTNPNVNLASFGDWLYGLAQVTSQVVGRQKTEPSKSRDKPKTPVSKTNHVNAQLDNSARNRSGGSGQQIQNSGLGSHSENNASNLQDVKKCPVCSLETCKQIHECSKLNRMAPKDRWNAIKTNRLCYSCLGKHRQYKCRSRKKCTIDGCESTHHTLLHDKERQAALANSSSSPSKPKTSAMKSSSIDNTGSSTGNCNSLQSKRVPALFKIVPVVVYSKKKFVNTFAYLDDGSDLSLMERGIANELGLLGTPDVLSVQWAFKNSEEETDTETVSVRVSGDFKCAEQYKIHNLYTVDKLYLPSQSITREWLDSYSHLKDLPVSTYEDGVPRILIGLHSSRLIISLHTIEGGLTEPIACKTRLGWIVQGPDDNSLGNEIDDSESVSNVRVSMNMCEGHADNQLHQLVKEFFAFENCGIRVPEKLLESKDVIRARDIMERTTIKKDGRYETGLLWRYDDIYLPDSFGMAMRRLICLENKMKKDPHLSKKLCDQIEDFVAKKYIRKLLPHEIDQKNARTWYLPIFVVFNPKKPLKFRTVWDAAAKVKNVSLNSVLLKGPDQLVPLPDVLRRFRERLYAVTGDIGEMFHRVRLIKEDRCAQRFFWRDGQSNRAPDVYEMEVLTFGAACSPSSAQFVKNKNAEEYKSQLPRAVEAIVENTYIDDMLDCTDTMDEAIDLLTDVKFIHKQASFEFGKMTSNSVEILQALGEDDNQQIKNLNLSPEITTERVLGMFWNTSSDMFTYSLKYAKIDEMVMSGDRNPTKREVLRALMSIFDPLGLIAHVLIYAKILLQKIWRKGIDWDEPISGSLQDDWLVWIRLLPEVERLEIPRLYSPSLSPQRPQSIQMHTFVDAGIEACAALTYFRFEGEFGVDCVLAGAKTKVAPNKPLTVPRLELQAAVLGSRLANNIGQSQRFKIDKKYFWSDSQTVLSWIMSDTRKYNQFVAFRVGEILDNSTEEEWNWVSTVDNVADEATKSSNKPDISSSSRWFKSSSFLYQPEDQWNKIGDKNRYKTDEELRPKYLLAQFVNKCDNVIDPNRFSSWQRLRRTMAFVLRFIDNLRHGRKNRQIGPLSRVEYIRAENHLYRQAQRDKFPDEIIIMRHNYNSTIDKRKEFDKTSPLRTYSPYIDDTGVVRMRTRIVVAKHLPPQAKRPIILPRDHRITKLIVFDFHRMLHHSNHQTTLNKLNEQFCIPSLRRTLKSVIQNMCQRCMNDRANPKIPEMADLPPARVATFNKPFSYVGIDYFGPISVKVNRTKRKRWGVLITCLTTRAVHIEVAEALTTSECIMAIRRFIGRRGTPIEYYSDNGTNFHGSEKELRAEFEKLNFDKIQETFTNSMSQWHFNPPLAPHMGGSWERLIQTVKKILRKTMPTRTPTQKMFETYLIEAEHIINSRPLTYVHLDHSEDEVLTPNHFLLGSAGGARSPGTFDESCLLRDDWKAVQHLTDLFWRRFNIEYLPTLTRRTKWFKDVKPIEVGDVVLVVDDKHERNTWPKGIVEEVYPGKGNRIRSALVRLVRGRDKLSTTKIKDIKHQSLVRPVAKLAVLDVNKELSCSSEAVNGRENVGNSRSAGHMVR